MPVKALLFDIGGTVFDWYGTVTRDLAAHGVREARAADAIALAWRRRMFAVLDEVRAGRRAWMNADAMHRIALDEIAADHPALAALDAGARDALVGAWRRLAPWPDAPAAIARMRRRHTVVVLTVLSWVSAVASSKAAGIDWDGVLSCELLGHYKPDAEAYRAGARLLDLAPAEAMMVAAHAGDLHAAAAAGLKTAFVARPGESGPEVADALGPYPEFDLSAPDFADLAERLGA